MHMLQESGCNVTCYLHSQLFGVEVSACRPACRMLRQQRVGGSRPGLYCGGLMLLLLLLLLLHPAEPCCTPPPTPPLCRM